MAETRTIDGVRFMVPDGMTDDQVRAWAAQSGAAELQQNPPPAETGGEQWQQWAQGLSPLMAGIMEMRQFVTERIPPSIRTESTQPMPPEAMAALRGESPVSTALCGAYFPMATALAAPGKIIPQALVAGGLEYAREGATAGDAAKQAGLAGGLQFAGNSLTRVASGIAKGVRAYMGGPAPVSNNQALRIIAETGFGRGQIAELQQRSLRASLGRVFGIRNMDELTGTQLQQAADNIGKMFDDALSLTDNIDTKPMMRELSQIPDSIFPRKKAVLEAAQRLDGTTNSEALRGLHRTLRDLGAKMRRNPLAASWDDVADDALTLLDDAASNAGANVDQLGSAAQRWKVLKNIEELAPAWKRGEIAPDQLLTRLGRENYKGFGTTLKRGQTGRLDPDVGGFLDDVMAMAQDIRPVGRSGTPEALIGTGGLMGGGAGLMTGAIDPATAGAGVLAYGAVPPLAAAASIGNPAPIVGQVMSGARGAAVE